MVRIKRYVSIGSGIYRQIAKFRLVAGFINAKFVLVVADFRAHHFD